MQVSVGAGPARFYGLHALLWWGLWRALVGVGRLLMVAVSRPRTTAVVAGLCFAVWALVEHPLPSHVLLLVGAEVGYWWHLLGPDSFRRTRLPAVWRSVWVYRRRWRKAMRVAGLSRMDEAEQLEIPRLGRVTCTATTDLVRVRGLLGQRFADWEEAGPMLAHVFKATSVEVRRGDDRRLTLELGRGDVGRRWDRERVDA
jgi:hypothetical protein